MRVHIQIHLFSLLIVLATILDLGNEIWGNMGYEEPI